METDKRTDQRKKQTRVKVVIRVRPPLSTDAKVCVYTTEDKVEIINHRNIKENLQYQFSSVFDKSSCQREIFETCVKPLLNHALQGEHVSIFAYGPTGAGKTYTMLGTEDDPGMIPRVIHTLFHNLNKAAADTMGHKGKSDSHRVSFSFLEIYNEKVQDLLNPKETDLPIREDACHNIFVAGLTEKQIHNFNDFKNLFGPASNNRTVAATKLNDRSSRSHSIVQLKVDTYSPGKVFHGKIYLIDLAGSEDNRRTGNIGIRLKESGAINKSLFVLGEVVDAINNNLPRIPYRNSKLTRLLQDSIGGSCHSVMITNVAPEESYYYDTYCTLNFASKSRKVVNSSVISVTDLHPQEPQKTLKRSSSATSMQAHSGVKKAKLSAQKSQSDSNLSTPADATPFMPLVQRQNHLEKTVKGCMQKMEDLLHRWNTAQTGSSPGDSAMAEIQRQLSEVKAQLQDMRQQQEGGEGKTETHRPQERRKSLRKALAAVPSLDSVVLKDKTNVVATDVSKKYKPWAKTKLVDDGPSCSPLFPDTPPLHRFKKGFKSTATDMPLARRQQDLKCTTPHKTKEAATSTAQQQKQNTEFLDILNEAPVKRLQDLHTVGAKRARLIFEWRQAHGHFASFSDLQKIPGFTEKYVTSLLQRNFILTDV